MSELKITPGNWALAEDGSPFIYTLNKHGINRFYFGIQPGRDDNGNVTSKEELIANARAIAAIPEAIKAFESLIDNYVPVGDATYQNAIAALNKLKGN